MPRLLTVIRDAATAPIPAIQGVIAFVSLIMGLYIASPFYVATSSASVAVAFQEQTLQQVLIGLGLFALPALPIVLGFFFVRFATVEWYSRSTLWMFTGLLFLTILRLVTIGLFPLTWLTSLALVFIIGICHLYWKVH